MQHDTVMAKVREILRKLKKDGWYEVRAEGGHHQYKHPVKPGRVTISYAQEGEDIPTGTLRSIYRQAGWEWK